ncbi:MAG TPA: hypothetical protein VN854_01465 [Mycoplasmatales bacterium]|nr:hypothetical protein [Mycoplasmatales bacterium]
MELQIEVRQIWLALFATYFMYCISGYTLIPVTIFILSFGLLEDIEETEDDGQSEESEYDEDAFVNDTPCDFKLDFFTLQVDNASKKGKADRRFLNNDFIFESARNLEQNLVKNFNKNLNIVDINDFIYVYVLFSSSFFVFEEHDFNLRKDLEDDYGVDEEENAFFAPMFDRSLHHYFDIGLDISGENLKFGLDSEFELKFFDFYKEKSKFINENFFFINKFSKIVKFPFNINLLNKPKFSKIQQDFFISDLNKFYFDDMVFKLYEKKISKTKFTKRKKFKKGLDGSFFEWSAYPESKIVRSSISDVILSERFFFIDPKFDSYYEML